MTSAARRAVAVVARRRGDALGVEEGALAEFGLDALNRGSPVGVSLGWALRTGPSATAQLLDQGGEEKHEGAPVQAKRIQL